MLTDAQYHAALDFAIKRFRQEERGRTLPLPEIQAIANRFESAARAIYNAKESPELVAIAKQE